jgi:hypothetical protein
VILGELSYTNRAALDEVALWRVKVAAAQGGADGAEDFGNARLLLDQGNEAQRWQGCPWALRVALVAAVPAGRALSARPR